MLDAARKYDRVVQVGIQSCSGRNYEEACGYIRTGPLGKVAFAKGWESARQKGIGYPPDEAEGAAVYGENGYVVIGKGSWRAYDEVGKIITSRASAKAEDDVNHKRGMLDAIRTGGRPACDIEIGHCASALIHLGNVAWRADRKLCFDPVTESSGDDSDANALVSREYREDCRLRTTAAGRFKGSGNKGNSLGTTASSSRYAMNSTDSCAGRSTTPSYRANYCCVTSPTNPLLERAPRTLVIGEEPLERLQHSA